MITEENADQYIELIQALKDKELEFLDHDGKWVPLTSLGFHLPLNRYRRKPKPEEFWIIKYRDGSAKAFTDKEDALERQRDAARYFGYKPKFIHVKEVL